MNENQKKVLKGYLFLIFGIIIAFNFMIFIIIYANVLKNPYGDFPVIMSLMFVICGVILIIIASKYNIMLISNFRIFINPSISTGSNRYFIQGVPQNNFNEFILNFNEIINIKNLMIQENSRGIYTLELNNKIIKFDMRGWIRKKYYIYEYILTILQLNKKNKIFKKYFINNIQELKIIFVKNNGKYKYMYLIKNNETYLTLLYKYRMKIKHNILSISGKKKHNDIKNFYNFNFK